VPQSGSVALKERWRRNNSRMRYHTCGNPLFYRRRFFDDVIIFGVRLAKYHLFLHLIQQAQPRFASAVWVHQPATGRPHPGAVPVLDALKTQPKLTARPRQRLTSYDFIESAGSHHSSQTDHIPAGHPR